MTDKELLEQFQLLAGMIQDSETRISKKIEQSEARTKVYIENTVTAQIKSLFDGYQSALENQALLKVANQTLAQELDDIKTRLSALESMTA